MLKNNKAFTLIELMVVIVIVGIIGVAVANYDFNSMGDRQNLESFTNKIIGEFETVRTNALIGRGTLGNNLAPSYWEMSFGIGKKGFQVKSFTKNEETGNYTEEVFSTFAIPEDSDYNIEQIICTKQADEGLTNGLGENEIGIIRLEGSKYTFPDTAPKIINGCENGNTYQKVSFRVVYKDYFNVIEFNTISGLIERIDRN